MSRLRYSLVMLIGLVIWLALLGAAGALIWVQRQPWICVGEVYCLIGLTVFIGGHIYDARQRRPARKSPKSNANIHTAAAILAALLLIPPDRAEAGEAPAGEDARAIAERLAAIEKLLEEKRAESGTPGMAIAIVKDDKVVLLRGFGLRDVDKKTPVTPQTLFAVGSTTKAFTALAALMGAEDGKLSLDDAPRKHLPYFKLRDPEADEKCTIRDLLCHRTGLGGTDLAWYTGALNREEVIRVAGLAKATEGFREKWQYQNVMYSAAGECAARAQGRTWEELIAKRIFEPLGMTGSNLSIQEMLGAPDFSIGYTLDDARTPKPTPMRDLKSIAPAGAINSSAQDMAQWVRLLLGGGKYDGKQLLGEAGFRELFKPQAQMAPNMAYGLGWMISEWEGRTLIEHTGGIDGFGALVSLLPAENIGLVELSNNMMAPHPSIREIVFANLLNAGPASAPAGRDAGPTSPDAGPALPAADPQQEVGRYAMAGFSMQVSMRDGKLFAETAGQPPYPLISLGGRKYKLGEPAPPGFFVTFRPVKERDSSTGVPAGNETEMFLEQPWNKVTLAKDSPEAQAAKAAESANYAGPNKDLLGQYESPGVKIEIAPSGGKVAMQVGGQPPYPLKDKDKAKGVFVFENLPEGFELTVRRGADGKVTGVFLKQPRPQPDAELTRVATAAPTASVEEIIQKAIEAAGGEAALGRLKSARCVQELDFENQGLTGEGVNHTRAPNHVAMSVTLTYLGKKLGTVGVYFDGSSGAEVLSFAPLRAFGARQVEEHKTLNQIDFLRNWKTIFKTSTVLKAEKVNGEDADVVESTAECGLKITSYFSRRTHLLLKRECLVTASAEAGNIKLPVTTEFSDYRAVEGLMLPFTIVQSSHGLGRAVIRIKEYQLNVEIPDAVFKGK